MPGFVLNLPAFHEPGVGLDISGFASAVDLAVTALTLIAPSASRIGIAMSDLDGLLAALGLDYDGEPAREVAACLAALLRGCADASSGAMAHSFGAVGPATSDLPIPQTCAVPGLAAAAQLAVAGSGPALHHIGTTCIASADAAEALLDAETSGIAPAFSHTRAEGILTNAARARLAALGLTPELALARLLSGNNPLPIASSSAHAAMHDAVAPFVHTMPARPGIELAAARER